MFRIVSCARQAEAIRRKMKHFRKIIFPIFSLLLVFFSSCSFFDSDEEKSSSGSVLNSSKILTGKVLAGGEVSSLKLQNSARTILPDFPSSNLTYSVFASSDGGATKSFEANVSSDGSFSLIISTDGIYVVYAEISDSNGKVVYKGSSDSLTVSGGAISKNGTATTEIGIITASPVQSGSGNAAIAVEVSSATEIKSVKAEWKKSDSSSAASFTKTVFSDSDRSFTLYLSDSTNSEKSIDSGTYSLSLFFYSDSSSSIEVYRISETVLVYDNLTASVCSGNASYFSGNTIKITSSLISGTAYARGTDAKTLPENSNGGNGTYYAPFSSISDALSKVEASGSDTMTIYLDGTFSLSGALSLSVSSSKNLNIYGVTSAENSVITDPSGNGIEIASGNVNLKAISVLNCGGTGITNAGTLALENCVISGNIGGISGSGDISISGGATISENYTSPGKSTLSNISLATSSVLKITSAITSGSKIGITLSSALASESTQTITSGWKTYNSSADASTIFSSDDDDYEIALDSAGEVAVSNPSASYYVSSSGSDTYPGTKELPFATLQKAADKILAANEKTQTDYTIYLLSDITLDSSAKFTNTSETFADDGSIYTLETPTLCSIENTGGNELTLKVISWATDSALYSTISGDGSTVGRIFKVNGSTSAINLSVDNLNIKNLRLYDSSNTDKKYHGSVLFMSGTNDTASFGSGVTISGCVTFCSLFYPQTGTLTLSCTASGNKNFWNGGVVRLDGSGALNITGGSYSGSVRIDGASECQDLGLYGGFNSATTSISGGTIDSISTTLSNIEISGSAYIKAFNFGNSHSSFTIGNTYTTTDVSKIIYEGSTEISGGETVFSIAGTSSLSISDVIGKFAIYDSASAVSPSAKYSLVADSTGKKALLKIIYVSGPLTVKISDNISLSLSSSSLSTSGATTLTLSASANGTSTAVTNSNTTAALYNGGALYADSSVATSVSADNTISVSGAVAPGSYQLLVTFTYDGKDYQATFNLTAEDED